MILKGEKCNIKLANQNTNQIKGTQYAWVSTLFLILN